MKNEVVKVRDKTVKERKEDLVKYMGRKNFDIQVLYRVCDNIA